MLPMVVLPVIATLTPAVLARQSLPTTRTLYASVTDETGQPVLNLSASDFVVKDGDSLQQIRVRNATAPLRSSFLTVDVVRFRPLPFGSAK